MSRKIEVGGYYILNEDLKDFIMLKDCVVSEKIDAGTKCKVVEHDGEYVTLLFPSGIKVRTESHMIDNLEE